MERLFDYVDQCLDEAVANPERLWVTSFVVGFFLSIFILSVASLTPYA